MGDRERKRTREGGIEGEEREGGKGEEGEEEGEIGVFCRK